MEKVVNSPGLLFALDTLVKKPLNRANDAALVNAANAVWYSHSDLINAAQVFLSQHTDELEIRRAGYLLERFTRFSCVTDIRVSEVFKALDLFLRSAPKQEVTPQTAATLRKRRDELALSWGLNEGLGLKVQTLLPFQTRHYEAEQRAAFV
nr:hypothetical protein [Pseudomonas sp. Tri1]